MLSPDRWAQLSPLLDEVLDLDGEQRQRWIQALRDRTPADADEIEALLAGTIDPQLGTGALAAPVAALALQGALAGIALGAWTLERPIGSGGMGAVWLARRNDGRFAGTAAVKLLHPSLSTGVGEDRFRFEAQALARLTHPQISRLYDAGITPTGQPYLVLQYVDGQPLDQWCVQRRASRDERLRLFRQVLDTVAHAHAQGVVHGDLKPSNLLVTADGTVMLLDFGIARFADPAGGFRDEGLVQAFTPRYAAPEQVQGQGITTASDVYAAGVIAYELLAGRHPTSPADATTHEVLAAIVDDPPAPLPASVPRALADVILHALQKDPSRRYDSIAAFIDDLERVGRFEPTRARPGSGLERAGLFVRRHQAGVTTAIVVMLALLTTAGVSTWQLVETRRQRDVAQQAARQASVMAQVLSAGYGELDTRDTTITQAQRLRRIRDIVASSEVEPAGRADLLLAIAAEIGDVGQRTLADSVYDDALAAAVAAGSPAVLADVYCARAPGMSVTASPDSARRDLDRADSLLRLAAPVDDAVRSACDGARAMLMGMRGQGDSARTLLSTALARRIALGDSTSDLYVTLMGRRAVIQQYAGTSATGANDLEALQRAYERTGRRLTMSSVLNLTQIASMDLANGDLRRADSVAQLAFNYLGGDAAFERAPLTLLVLRAELLSDLGARREAITWYRRALGSAERGGEPNYTMRMRMDLAEHLLGDGDRTAARAVLDSCVREVGQRGGPTQRLKLAFLRSRFLAADGRTAAATSLLDSVMRAHGYPDKLRMINKRRYLSAYINALIDVGRYRDADAALRLAAPLYDDATSPTANSSHLARVTRVAWGLGMLDSALTTARRVAAMRRLSYPPGSPMIADADLAVARLERGERLGARR